jgi:hypothetical protein
MSSDGSCYQTLAVPDDLLHPVFFDTDQIQFESPNCLEEALCLPFLVEILTINKLPLSFAAWDQREESIPLLLLKWKDVHKDTAAIF